MILYVTILPHPYLSPVAQCVDIHSFGPQQEELSILTDYCLVACFLSRHRLQHIYIIFKSLIHPQPMESNICIPRALTL